MYPSRFAVSRRAARPLALLLALSLAAPLPALAQQAALETAPPAASGAAPAAAPLEASAAAAESAVAPQAPALAGEGEGEAVAAADTTSLESADAATSEGVALESAEGALDGQGEEATAEEGAGALLAHDLSPWGMYQNADIIVKMVMIGLAIASVITWTICLAKGLEIFISRRRIAGELSGLKRSRTLREADLSFRRKGLSHRLVQDVMEEVKLSADTREREGIKERAAFRLERLVAASGRAMSRGTGPLATIGSTAPFVGLFGTVWGIMNSFIGIAKSQTTNLAVVAPGIAEALLATALGLVAAIPAVVIYNVFARSISGYKAEVSDCSAEVLLLLSRELDHLPAEQGAQVHLVKRAV